MRIAVGLLTAAFAAVALGVALAFAFGGVTPAVAWLALLGGLLTGVAAGRDCPASAAASPPRHPVEWLVIATFALVCFRAFFWLLYPKGPDWFILSPNNLGDLSLHLAFIQNLAAGVPFWPASPILTGEPLKYPLAADLLNALLLRVGLPLEAGLVWVALGGSILTVIALWRWGGAFALAAFLFGGGLAGFGWLREAVATGHFAFADLQGEATWKNLFLALFVTQRGLLLALPAGLLLLAHARSRWLRGEPGVLPGWAALLLYATMPLHNVHAFLYLSVALAFTFIFAPAPARWRCLGFVAAAVVPATLCAGLVTGGFAVSKGIHFLPGWMQNDEKGVPAWWFWLRNFGLYLPLGAALLGLAIHRRSREQLAIALPAAVVFAACVFVSFAVWPWDNTKLLLWCWLAVAPGIWTELLAPLRLPLRAAVCFVLFFTGAVSLVGGLDNRHGYRLASLTEVEAVGSAVRPIPVTARFAGAPEFAHPLLLAGRNLVVGYDGHLWSHGLDYGGKMADLENLMRGAPDWRERAQRLGANYLYWGEMEDRRFPLSSKPWVAECPVVARDATFTIYRLDPPR